MEASEGLQGGCDGISDKIAKTGDNGYGIMDSKIQICAAYLLLLTRRNDVVVTIIKQNQKFASQMLDFLLVWYTNRKLQR